jgi:7-cyano-7-deazaguanine synthase
MPDLVQRDITVLLSGGLDSSLCAVLAHQMGRLRNVLHINYHQPAGQQEDRCSRALAEGLNVPFFDLREVGVAGCVDAMAIGTGAPGPRVVPGRNLWMASLAISHALQTGCTSVWLGCNADDAANYPDCRPEFIDALNAMAQATYGIGVAAPLMLRTKREVVEKWVDLGRSLDETWSCYQPRDVRVDFGFSTIPVARPCGTCDACVLRDAAERALTGREW